MKTVIAKEKVPGAIGPYSQAIGTGSMVFASDQLLVDPATGAFPEGIVAQTKKSQTNAKAIIEAAGGGMQRSKICDQPQPAHQRAS